MNKIKLLFSLLFLLNINISASELKDPITRDEKISNTIVNVSVKQEGMLFKYEYSIKSPRTNLGIINNFLLDISCDIDFSDIKIPVPNERLGHLTNKSSNGQHVPAEVFAAYGTSNAYGITKSNHVLWGLYLKPGKKVERIWILSPAPPGPRNYLIEPFIDNNPDIWNYSKYNEDDPNVPWIEDFTITGTIIGPSCKSDESSGNLFKGTGEESFYVNGLLQYSNPTKDPLYIKRSDDGIKMIIHYSKSIHKQSFHAKLNNEDISGMFHSNPNTSEIIQLQGPWKKLNKLMLSVLGIQETKNKDNPNDIDTFHI